MKEITNIKDLLAYVDHKCETYKLNSTASKDTAVSLPLRVWKAKGYDVRPIKRNVTPTMHPVLGKCYTLTLNTKVDVEEEGQRRSQNVVIEQPRPSSTIMTKEERDQAKEQIRQSKAEATQQARDLKDQRKRATKLLPEVSKAGFNMDQRLTGKFWKSLEDDKFKQQGKDIRKTLQTHEQTITKAFTGVTLVGIDIKVVEKTLRTPPSGLSNSARKSIASCCVRRTCMGASCSTPLPVERGQQL